MGPGTIFLIIDVTSLMDSTTFITDVVIAVIIAVIIIWAWHALVGDNLDWD